MNSGTSTHNFISHQGSANSNHNRYHFTSTRMTKIEKSNNTKRRAGYGATGNFTHSLKKCTSIQPLWKPVWQKIVPWCMCVSSVVSNSNPVDCSPPGSSVPGILQARTPERVAMCFLQGTFLTRGSKSPASPALVGRFFTSELPCLHWHGKFHGQRNLAGYSPWDHRVEHDWAHTHTHTHTHTPEYKQLFDPIIPPPADIHTHICTRILGVP